jgi:corrinoid protein of di/trimethylamine methyltransferase
MSKVELYEKLTQSIVAGDRETTVKLAQDALARGYDAFETLTQGCVPAMATMSDRYDKGDAFVPDILTSSDAMYGAIGVLKPHIKVDPTKVPGKIVIGVVEGDVHDIGKNIVKTLLDVAGFNVIDLGRNVPLRKFVDTVKEQKPDILAMSALMTTTMLGIPEEIQMLKEAGLRDNVKVMIGGAPLSASYAEKVGADGYAPNAPQAIKAAENLVKAHRGLA